VRWRQLALATPGGRVSIPAAPAGLQPSTLTWKQVHFQSPAAGKMGHYAGVHRRTCEAAARRAPHLSAPHPALSQAYRDAGAATVVWQCPQQQICRRALHSPYRRPWRPARAVQGSPGARVALWWCARRNQRSSAARWAWSWVSARWPRSLETPEAAAPVYCQP